jgi:hypothetical protein
MMRRARANKPDGYLLGSYRIATAPEPNSSRLTSLNKKLLRHPGLIAYQAARPVR